MFFQLILMSALALADLSGCDVIYEIPAPDGRQLRDTFGPGGQLRGGALTIWNSCVDGPIPAGAPVGYADRSVDQNLNPTLVANATKKAAFDARAAAAAQAVSDAAALKDTLRTLKAKIKAKTATATDVRDALGAFLDVLNMGN